MYHPLINHLNKLIDLTDTALQTMNEETIQRLRSSTEMFIMDNYGRQSVFHKNYRKIDWWSSPYNLREIRGLLLAMQDNVGIRANTIYIDKSHSKIFEKDTLQMELLTFKILDFFHRNQLYNWEAIQNLILKDSDYFSFTVEQAECIFKRFQEKGIISKTEFGEAYSITGEGRKLYNKLVEQYSKDEISKQPQQDNSVKSLDFIGDFIAGIQSLQQQDTNAECIKLHRIEGKKNEGSFRNWFIPWLQAKGYKVDAEPEKGNGYVDIRAFHEYVGYKVVEFKGWWNSDKNTVIRQVCKYLTEFEGDAYVFMINHTRKIITEEYKHLITSTELNYVLNSWEELKFKNTSYTYYRSQHNTFQGIKSVYHFIFPIHI